MTTNRYIPQEIEPKWQKLWETTKVHKAYNPGDAGFDTNKPPFYILDMFPYPSGSGLHVGHASGYIGTDIITRKKRMEGFNVLHPMGWDAFGLPAEQYAIQTNQQPRDTTDINTKNFRRQLKLIGLSYDWDREIDTSDPKYYKWTQWIFLQLYKKGLVYRKEMPVWWCEELKTVLANEEVINGRSERGNFPCERRPLVQWVFKITEYAERLLEDLEGLDWPENVKKMQEDWIGKSIGAEIEFSIEGHSDKIKVFSTRPDTLFGVTALVLAPEHALVKKLMTADKKAETEKYLQASAVKSDRERKAEAEDFTAQFVGAYGLHPLTQEKIPIYVADYVLVDYGTGAVMAVPAHDSRDWKLAQKYKLPIKHVIVPGSSQGKPKNECFEDDGFLISSSEFNGLSSAEARLKITEKLVQKNLGQKKITYKIRDWIFSRQRYWGEPFPLLLTENDDIVLAEDLPVELPPMKDFKPSSDGSSPLGRNKAWVEVQDPKTGKKLFRVTDTMPGWAGSCWYYLRFMDPLNTKEAFSKEAIKYWHEVNLYVGGASHAVMHLLYARFWHKVLYDIGLVPTKEPFKKLFNQGMVTAFAYRDKTGRLVAPDEVVTDGPGYKRKSDGEPVEKMISKMAKSLRNVVNPDDVINEKGCDILRVYEMFMGPLSSEKPWDDEGISGVEKFLRRVWALYFAEDGSLKSCYKSGSDKNKKLEHALHKCLKRVNDSFNNFNFNTAVAGMMEALNDFQATGAELNREQGEFFIKMLFPFAPHIACEIWERLGNKTYIDFAPWPELNPNLLVQDEFELVMQVNGKIRKRLLVSMGLKETDAIEIGKKELAEFLIGKQIVKTIYVPNKLLNVVVK